MTMQVIGNLFIMALRPLPSLTETVPTSLLLSALLETVPEVFYFKDLECRFVAASQAKAERHGFASARELIGKTDAELFTSAHAAKATEDELRIIATGRPLVAQLERLTWPDGEESWTVTNKYPLHGAGGEIIGTFGFSRDVTSARRMRETIRKLHRELNDAERSALRAEVTTGVLHNVNNAVTAAELNVAILKLELEQAAARLDPDIADRLTTITRTLSDTVHHVTGIIRTQQGLATRPCTAEPLDVVKLIEEALGIAALPLREAQVAIVRDYAPVPLVLADRHAALQILLNLIVNAREAMRANSATDRRLTVRTSAGGDGITLAIIDNGAGIEPEHLTKLFSRGFTTRSDGHGVGLYWSRQAADAMGATLEATSSGLGKGAAFLLTLPSAACASR